MSDFVADAESSETTVKPTSTLPAVIEYHMLYLSKEGYQTSLKIALGEGVSVNTIIGMSMIRPAKLSLDLSDDVMEAGVLDTTPFPITFKQTIRSMPDFSNLDETDIKTLCSHPVAITKQNAIDCRSDVMLSTETSDTEISSIHKEVPQFPSMFPY